MMKYDMEHPLEDVSKLYELVYGRTLKNDRASEYNRTKKELRDQVDSLCDGVPTQFSNDRINKRIKALRLIRDEKLLDTENVVTGALDKVEIPVEEEKKKKRYTRKPYNAKVIPILQKINSNNTKDAKDKQKIQAIIRDLSANEKKMQLRKRKPEVNNN